MSDAAETIEPPAWTRWWIAIAIGWAALIVLVAAAFILTLP